MISALLGCKRLSHLIVMENSLNSALLRVLVVEDDTTVRDLLCASIEAESGLQLCAALDCVTDAIAWLSSHPLDILLTDLGLPDGSGIEVISACAALHPDADILVITMFGDEKNVLASIDAGAVGYILKDAGDLNVARFIEDLRNGGSPMSPLVARKLLARHQQSTVRTTDRYTASRGVSVNLTARELESLDLIARGYTYAEIAKLLDLSISTVQTHVKNLYAKLSVHSRGEAVFEAHKLGLLKAGLLSSTTQLN